eukprot:jgi/Chlat1/8017/Chrsp7S07769
MLLLVLYVRAVQRAGSSKDVVDRPVDQRGRESSQVGHAGTLDLTAAELLICFVGRATKLADRLACAT